MMTLNYENAYKSSIDMAVMEANPHKTGVLPSYLVAQVRWIKKDCLIPQSKGAWVDELMQKG